MKIKRVEIQNFFSIGNITLELDQYSGVILVTGENQDILGSNGSGKSSLFDAICWGLFGKSIRKSTEESMVRYGTQECYVKLILSDGSEITRTRKPTSLSFLVDGIPRTQESSSETQKEIEKHIKSSYKTFLSSSVFGQHNNINLLDASPEMKRTIIRSFLPLEEVFDFRENAKKLKSKHYSNLSANDALISDTEKTIESLKRKIDLIKKEEGRFSKCKDLDFSTVLKEEGRKAKLELEITNLRNKNLRLDMRIATLCNQLDKLDNSLCSFCNQNVTKEFSEEKKKEIEEEKDDKWTETLLNQTEITKLEDELKEISIPVQSSEISLLKTYNELKGNESSMHYMLEENKIKLEDLKKKKISLDKEFQIMKFWDQAFSEKGLIQYVISNVLDYFNTRCNYYLKFLSKNKISIQFDSELRETIIVNAIQTHYISLSGGEKKKVNLSIMMALQSLLSSVDTQDLGFVFFDEIAENLDDESLEGLYLLLQELSKNRDVFLITHNNYLLSSLNKSQTLQVTKSDGISYLATN